MNLRVEFGSLATPWLVSLGFICLQAGWMLGQQLNSERYYIIITRRGLSAFYSIGLLAVFILSLYIYASQFGGYRAALLLGDSLRYGQLETNWRAAGSRFFPIVTILLCYWVAKYVVSNVRARRRRIEIAFITICATFQVMVFPLFSGRGYVINVIIGLYLTLTYITNRTRLWLLLVASIPIYITIIYGKQFFYAAPSFFLGESRDFADSFQELSLYRLADASQFMDPFFKECAHAPVSIEVALSVAGQTVAYTFFRDFLFGVTAFVPQTVLSAIFNVPPSVSSLNTELLINQSIASIPPGYLAHCIYAGGWIGLIIGCVGLGAVGGAINAGIESSLRRDFRWATAAVLFAQLYGAFIINGDPKVFIQSDLSVPLWLAILIAPFARFMNQRSLQR